MARRKTPKARSSVPQSGQKLVYMGDVRETPVELRVGGSVVRPLVALWVRADDGVIVGQLVDEPGNPAETLVKALREPVWVPGQSRPTAIPDQLVLFDEGLARQVKALLAPMDVEIVISPPFKPFDDLFAGLFAHFEQARPTWLIPDLPDDILRPLVSAAERLCRAKLWEYVFDNPPFALVPSDGGGRPLFACVLGANQEVFGVALYTSLEDYEAALALGESEFEPDAESPAEMDAAATMVLDSMRHRTFMVLFERKDEADAAYRDRLAQCGWPRRLGMVPTFAVMGGGKDPGPLSVEDASEVTPAVDALVAFCQRHRKRLVEEQFPIRDIVEVASAGKVVRIDVSIPGKDPSAPPATVFRLKVSLVGAKDIWRTIDVLSNQTLEDLHYAIQQAFDWDDDHLYAFFMSGKAWDRSTEYLRPEGMQPGDRSSRVRLDRLGLRARKRFLYIFDFGDEWRHDIRVEKAGLPPEGGDYPRIVEEHGEAPPQYGGWDEDDEFEEDEESEEGAP